MCVCVTVTISLNPPTAAELLLVLIRYTFSLAVDEMNTANVS